MEKLKIKYLKKKPIEDRYYHVFMGVTNKTDFGLDD
jgi:hypothetical protein